MHEITNDKLYFSIFSSFPPSSLYNLSNLLLKIQYSNNESELSGQDSSSNVTRQNCTELTV